VDSGTLLLMHLAATWYMTGLIWLVQIVHYPLMQMVGREGFIAYSIRHQSATSLVVGPPMLVEVATAAMLLSLDAELRRSPWFLASCGLLAIVWLSTALWQMPLHRALLDGFDEGKVRALVQSNWVRTIAWSVRAAIITWLVHGRLKGG
jgi:hypothetical protein